MLVHGMWLPGVMAVAASTEPGACRTQAIIPAIADHLGADGQHRFAARFSSEDAIACQPLVDDASHAALDGATRRETSARHAAGNVQARRK